jgi:hypothetical protein
VPCGLFGLVLLSGCGVADYESKMLKAQIRLKRYEEEKELLAEPLIIPSRENKEGKRKTIANVFLRPPKGIVSRAANADNPRDNLLYSYNPRSAREAGAVAMVELAAGSQKAFEGQVLRCFNTGGKAYPKARAHAVRHPLREVPMNFETTEFEHGQYFYSINICRIPQTAIAIVYWLDKKQTASATRAVELSLESFAVEQEADRLRAAYGKDSPLLVPQHPVR